MEWTILYHIILWVDLDDNKIPYISAGFKSNRMWMMTITDQKHKPVIHCMTSVSTGMTLWIFPEKIRMKRNDMFWSATNSIPPSGNESLRANLTFFIDRGYLEITRYQNVDNVSNQ